MREILYRNYAQRAGARKLIRAKIYTNKVSTGRTIDYGLSTHTHRHTRTKSKINISSPWKRSWLIKKNYNELYFRTNTFKQYVWLLFHTVVSISLTHSFEHLSHNLQPNSHTNRTRFAAVCESMRFCAKLLTGCAIEITRLCEFNLVRISSKVWDKWARSLTKSASTFSS